jgi:hypothetical protein
MNGRHAAALALVVWYLLVPVGPTAMSYYLPLSQWKLIDTYHSESDCKKDQPAISQVNVRSICIASDDPRLKKGFQLLSDSRDATL